MSGKVSLFLKNRSLGYLLAGRFLRSLSQAYLVVIVPLYLAGLGYGAVPIGLLLTLTAVGTTAMGLGAGLLADRIGRKAVLLAFALLTTVGALGYVFGRSLPVLIAASILGTIGRGGGAGSGGAFGPFYSAEQALVTEHAPPPLRTAVFGSLSFVGAIGATLGSLLAAVPDLLPAPDREAGFVALFGLTALLGLVLALSILPVAERRDRSPVTLRGLSWSLIGRFSLVNAVNGLGIGFLGPFVTYWFYRRYGVGAAQIGLLFTGINLLSTVPYLLAARVTRRFGSVATVVGARLVSVLLLALVPFMPGFLWAGAVFTLRTLFNTLSLPVRQSYLMGVVRERERSSAAAISNLPAQLSASLGPVAGGFLLDAGWVEVPLWLAAFFQAINGLLYWRFFAGVPPEEERRPPGPTAGA